MLKEELEKAKAQLNKNNEEAKQISTVHSKALSSSHIIKTRDLLISFDWAKQPPRKLSDLAPVYFFISPTFWEGTVAWAKFLVHRINSITLESEISLRAKQGAWKNN